MKRKILSKIKGSITSVALLSSVMGNACISNAAILGDYDENNIITANDSARVLIKSLNPDADNITNTTFGDVDGDGSLTASDAADILTKVLDADFELKHQISNNYDILVDPSINADQPDKSVYKTVKAAYDAAPAGTETNPTVIGIMPSVYLLEGNEETNGLIIDKPYITLLGLSSNADNIILADNRGIQQGASSNYNSAVVATTENAIGFTAKNITFYNYCNLDIVYKRDESQNVSKRSETETQAFAFCGQGDKHYFDNCKFISLLDTTSNDAKRSYYNNCYIQGTNDFINGGLQVFNNSTIKEFSNHIVGGSSNIIFINTEFLLEKNEPIKNVTYFSKGESPSAFINCIIPSNEGTFACTPYPSGQHKYYFYNCKTPTGEKAVIQDSDKYAIELNEQQAQAYNLWNILRGDDDWDPAECKDEFSEKGNLPLRVTITPANAEIKSNETTASAAATVFPSRASQDIKWSSTGDVSITNSDSSVIINGTNETNESTKAIVTAESINGISEIINVTVNPKTQPSPTITLQPIMSDFLNGKVSIDYSLDLGIASNDTSLITWYRCDDVEGNNPVLIADTKYDIPCKQYSLSTGDIGKYIKAEFKAKSNLSNASEETITVISKQAVSASDVETINIYTDFLNVPTHPPLIDASLIDGKTDEIIQYRNSLEKSIPNTVKGKWNFIGNWYYNYGIDGASDVMGILTGTRYCRLVYPQVEGEYGNMEVTLELYPEKRACQGFGGQNQYQEVVIKYDPETQTGYGVRYTRTAADGKSVFYQLYKYDNGTATAISDEIQSKAFRSKCTLNIKYKDGKLTATASTDDPETNEISPELSSVSLTADVEANTYGGVGIYHTGTVSGGNRTLIKSVDIKYNDSVQ